MTIGPAPMIRMDFDICALGHQLAALVPFFAFIISTKRSNR